MPCKRHATDIIQAGPAVYLKLCSWSGTRCFCRPPGLQAGVELLTEACREVHGNEYLRPVLGAALVMGAALLVNSFSAAEPEGGPQGLVEPATGMLSWC